MAFPVVPLFGNAEMQKCRNAEFCISGFLDLDFFILTPLPGGSRLALGPRASLGLGGWKIKITPVLRGLGR